MTDEQFTQLTALLERIAVALEPVQVSRPDPGLEAGGRSRAKLQRLIDEQLEKKLKEIVKPSALK